MIASVHCKKSFCFVFKFTVLPLIVLTFGSPRALREVPFLATMLRKGRSKIYSVSYFFSVISLRILLNHSFFYLLFNWKHSHTKEIRSCPADEINISIRFWGRWIWIRGWFDSVGSYFVLNLKKMMNVETLMETPESYVAFISSPRHSCNLARARCPPRDAATECFF